MPLRFELANRQRRFPFRLPFLRAMVEAAQASCQEAVCHTSAPLPTLTRVEGTILSDPAIAAVHAEFFDDPTPTDVITFHHGEILLGAETVTANARLYGRTPDEEAALCLIHGLLHLAGWDDQTPADAKKMARRQEQIFKRARRMVG